MKQIRIYLRQHAKQEQSIVWVSFYLNREKVNFSVKIKCKTVDWNVIKMRVKFSDPMASDKNLIIEQTLARINKVLVRYRLRERLLTRELFQRAYNRPSDFDDFYSFVAAYSQRIKRTLEDSTKNTQEGVIGKLKKFSPELTFDEITVPFLENYFSYLRKDLLNRDSTANKNMAVIKKYVRAAVREGYMDNNPFEIYTIRKPKAHPEYLTEDELTKMITIYKGGELTLPAYKTAQIFLYMCFSSQHISDAKRMTLEQFGGTSFTYYRKKMVTRKPDPVVVPISSALRSIIKEVAGNRKIGLLFDGLPADQKLNEYLKKIAKMAGIQKAISCKAARHTFATFYLSKTQNLTALQNIMGHSNINQTLIYAHVLESDKERGIACFNVFS